jgi:hypothetical protein
MLTTPSTVRIKRLHNEYGSRFSLFEVLNKVWKCRPRFPDRGFHLRIRRRNAGYIALGRFDSRIHITRKINPF